MIKNSIFFCFVIFLFRCSSPEPTYLRLTGPAMGTLYHITYLSKEGSVLQKGIDSILFDFNQSLSTYIPDSRISQFNLADSIVRIPLQEDPYFLPVLELSKKIYEETEGSFDPTIMPLIKFYGFDSNGKGKPSIRSNSLDSVINLVGFDMIAWEIKEEKLHLRKAKKGIELNFNSIAKGYGVDIISTYLENNNVENYLVEIGGEVRTKGVSPSKKKWKLGINTPSDDASIEEILLPVYLSEAGMATSGNYRDFYKVNGRKYVHIIDPVTGENRESDIASASIIASDCATSDALATASIVMGIERAQALINQLPGIEACFVIARKDTFETIYSKNFSTYINE